MRTLWLVARHEYRTLALQRRFLFTLLSFYVFQFHGFGNFSFFKFLLFFLLCQS